MSNVKLVTEERRETIARAIKEKSIGGEFYRRLVDEITSEYELTKEEKEHVTWGFVMGFANCLEGFQYLASRKKSNTNDMANN